MKRCTYTCDLCGRTIDDHLHGFSVYFAFDDRQKSGDKLMLRTNLEEDHRHICFKCVDDVLYASIQFVRLFSFYTDGPGADSVQYERQACADIAAEIEQRSATGETWGWGSSLTARTIKEKILGRGASDGAIAETDAKD